MWPMSISEITKFLRKKKNLTQMELAVRLNVSQTNIMFIETGKRTPSKELAKRMARFFDVPIQAFFDPDYDLDASSPDYSAVKIPYYNVVASAGNGIYAELEYISQYLTVSDGRFAAYLRGVKNPSAITIRGNSMSPGLNDGDMVVIDTDDHELVDGRIYVIEIEGELFIKRLFRDPFSKTVLVKSDNPQYPENRVGPESLHICGRMRWKMFQEV